MTYPTLCIRGAEVLADARAAATPRRDIWIAGDRIFALTEPGAPLPAAWHDVPAIEAAHCLAIPGLVNAHCHSYAALLHGTVPGAPLDLFVLEAMFPARPARRARPLRRSPTARAGTAQARHHRPPRPCA